MDGFDSRRWPGSLSFTLPWYVSVYAMDGWMDECMLWMYLLITTPVFLTLTHSIHLSIHPGPIRTAIEFTADRLTNQTRKALGATVTAVGADVGTSLALFGGRQVCMYAC